MKIETKTYFILKKYYKDRLKALRWIREPTKEGMKIESLICIFETLFPIEKSYIIKSSIYKNKARKRFSGEQSEESLLESMIENKND